MANFFSKLFGKKTDQKMEDMISEIVEGLVKKGNFNLDYQVSSTSDTITVNFEGEDGHLLTDRDALVLDGIQTFLKRFIQNKHTDKNLEVVVDCNGYLEASAEELRGLADKLKTLALEKNQVSYVRALPPRDRKTVHRHLAEDDRVKSQSIGDGFCKKIKISPAGLRNRNGQRSQQGESAEDNQEA